MANNAAGESGVKIKIKPRSPLFYYTLLFAIISLQKKVANNLVVTNSHRIFVLLKTV
jgi:hypothetical protein